MEALKKTEEQNFMPGVNRVSLKICFCLANHNVHELFLAGQVKSKIVTLKFIPDPGS